MIGRFEDQVALVTGAARGAGRAMALAFAREGAKVIVADIIPDLAERTAQEVRAISPASAHVVADLAKATDIDRLFDEVMSRYGRLDVAVNNAAYFSPRSSFVDFDLAEFDRQLAVNVRGTFLCMQRQARIMLEQGGGSIVNITSLSAHVGHPGMSAYSAAKHAILGLTKSAALELACDNVRITSLSPGAINTPGLAENHSPEVLAAMAEPIPAGRLVEPDDIARAVMFLASPDGALCVGHTLHVDGGLGVSALPREWL